MPPLRQLADHPARRRLPGLVHLRPLRPPLQLSRNHPSPPSTFRRQEPPATHHLTSSVDRLHGRGDLSAVFTGDRALTPWPRAPRIPGTADQHQAAFRRSLAGPPQLLDLDPRTLFASQRWVVAHHAAYYLTGNWERTGTTSADRHLDANRYPLVHVDPTGRHIILGGHHRSLVALLQGRPVRARGLRTDPDEAVPVIPLLLVGERTSLPHRTSDDEYDAALGVARGETVLVPDFEWAWSTLEIVGLRPDVIEDRVLYARRSQEIVGQLRGLR